MKTEELVDDPLFLDTIRNARSGRAANELGEALRDLIRQVEDTCGGGEMIVSLKFKPNGNGQVVMTDTFKVKAPSEPNGGSSIWFVDADNNLRRDDPRQPGLPFKETRTNRKEA